MKSGLYSNADDYYPPCVYCRFFPPDATHESTVAERLQAEVRERLSSTFKIPAAFWTPVAREASGFFGCQDHHDKDGSPIYCVYGYLSGMENALTS
jgi:hypothetical protein